MHLPLATIVVVVGVGVRVVVGLIIKTTMRIVAKDRETTPLLSPLIGSYCFPPLLSPLII